MAHYIFTAILCTLLKLAFAIDTLLPNETISFGQTLVSPNQDFEMGFFSPGSSSIKFLGIWNKNTPDVVVWVANRNNLISDSHGLTFSISGNGSLVISRNGSIIWSANPSGAASNPILKLLDNGNLVVVNETTEEDSSKRYLWQSFDYPTDTILPGMKFVDDPDAGVVKYLTSWRNLHDPSPGDFTVRVENHGLPEMVFYRGKTKTFRLGKWNGLYFGGYPRFPNPIFKPELVFRGERLISVDECDEYGVCGPNGICSIDRPILCQCLEGFAPKFQKEWNLQDWSGGCTRITPLNCKGGDGFQEVRGVKHADMLEFWLNTSMSLHECNTECLKHCLC